MLEVTQTTPLVQVLVRVMVMEFWTVELEHLVELGQRVTLLVVEW